MRAQATQPLAQFMDFTRFVLKVILMNSYEFMIDNIIMILKLTLSQPNLNYKDIVAECNPLGLLPDHVMKAICTFENTPKGFQELFQTVLVEIPVGKYFCRYLDEQTENHMLHVYITFNNDM